MEIWKNKWARFSVEILGIYAVGGLAAWGVVQLTTGESKATHYKHIYEAGFTDANKCLHDTPYDPGKGAIINLNYDKLHHEDTLSVVPEAANAYNPSVLFFTAGKGELIFADHYTGNFLVNAHCPVPEGY